MLYLLPFLLFFSVVVSAKNVDICDILNIKNCPGVSKQARRSSAQSLPSVTTASQFNPANVSHDRGLGVETFYQPGNSPSFNFVSGTGKVGAALVSTKLENAFFGNRVLELGSNYLDRRKNKTQYSSDKYNLALGAGLWKNRKASFDLGLLFKYNTDTKRLNPGVGASARLGIVTLGASVYKDDVKLDLTGEVDPYSGIAYSSLYGGNSYQESFTVQTYFAGVKLQNLFLDAGIIQTRYKFYGDDPSVTHIYSASYIYQNFLINVAVRSERSPALKYEGDRLVAKPVEKETYGGVQYSFNQHLIVGLHYNYYLLHELAGSVTVFF